ncbi:uncharacterized protein LOC116115200 isoform X2 [Pistacia vera]|nr:uncharacterized protein LOC116115200 isoform X2 [Pistacia vera]
MSQVRVLVMYNGEWFSSSSGHFVYNGGKMKGIIISDKITYRELVDRLYQLFKVDPNEYGIIMKALYKANIPTIPVEIVDDDDVRFFIHENVAQPTDARSPLCITLKCRESHFQEREGYYPVLDNENPFASRSESNQLSVVVPATQEGTQVEKPDPIAFNDDAMHISFGTQADLGCGDGLLADDLEVVAQNAQGEDVPHVEYGDKLHVRRSDNSVAVVDPLNSYEDIVCGKMFANKKELRKKLKLGAVKNNFEFKVKKSTKDRFEVVCADENCKWRLRATKLKDEEYFEIRRFSNVHICTKPPTKKRRKQKVIPAGERPIRKCGKCAAIGHNRQTCKNFTLTES